MGFYQDRVLPHLIHLSMRNPEATKHRQRIIPTATGRVLEIGIGSGLNLPFYGDVAEVVGLEPSERLVAMARKSAADAPVDVRLETGSAEALPFEDGRFDTVVSTWTLCSIPDVRVALTEMRRVLKPGGQMIFMEHGASPDHGVAAWQRRVDPIWTRFAGGCHINRHIDDLIAGAGFAIDRMETGYLVKGPKILTFHYEGRATRA